MGKNPFAAPTPRQKEIREKRLEQIWGMAKSTRLSPELELAQLRQENGEEIVPATEDEDEAS